MEIINFEKSFLEGTVDFWNRSCAGELPYKPFTKESFTEKFLKNPDFSYEGTFLAVEAGRVVGFANGIFRKNPVSGQSFEDAPGYVTFVLVDRDFRRKGMGGALLSRVEDYLKINGKKELEIKFFNPINLEWTVPGTDGHDHPNSPGVILDSPAYLFFKKHGYEKQSTEVSLHLDLNSFTMSEKYREKLKTLSGQGISMTYYDSSKHTGFDALFDHLKNEYWRKDIKDNLSLSKPLPVLVASDNGKICGYAGPITVQESGRGWFAGIGVDPDYEGRGIGTLLFIMLMKSFRDLGAGFSTLFTGIDNPARKIYERAGFRVVMQWAVMKKEEL